jgi:hypothetical protein
MGFFKEELLNEDGVITVSNKRLFYIVSADSYQVPNDDLVLTKGIWVRYRKKDIVEQYISEIKFYTNVHQLDPKFIPTASEEQLIQLLMDIDALPAMTDSNGAIFTHKDSILLI